MKENKDLIDWYLKNNLKEDFEMVGGFGEPASAPPDQNDLNPSGPESPQDAIQQALLKAQEPQNILSKSDQVIALDKMNAFKAYGLTEVIRQKLNLYSALAGREYDNPLAKEGVANDLKKITIELSDIIGAL